MEYEVKSFEDRAAPLLRKLVRERSTADLHSDSMTSKCVENISGTSKVWYFRIRCTVYHIWDLNPNNKEQRPGVNIFPSKYFQWIPT